MKSSVTIRPETPADLDAIEEVVRLAFGSDAEPSLVAALRRRPDFVRERSLVAERDGAVVGHVLFSPVQIESPGAVVPALVLAPLAVRPDCQRQGIGSALVRRGLEACRGLGHRIVIVIGAPAYYRRFGFTAAASEGLAESLAVHEGSFQVLELVAGALDGALGGALGRVSGTVRYPAPFLEF